MQVDDERVLGLPVVEDLSRLEVKIADTLAKVEAVEAVESVVAVEPVEPAATASSSSVDVPTAVGEEPPRGMPVTNEDVGVEVDEGVVAIADLEGADVIGCWIIHRNTKVRPVVQVRGWRLDDRCFT